MLRTITILLLIFSVSVHAQRVKLLEGDLKKLKGVTEYTVIFDYANVTIPGFESEELFLKDKVDKREAKEVGLGEEFRKNWFSDRENIHEPRFIDAFNEYFVLKRKIAISKDNPNAKYTLKVAVTEIYSGYHVGVFSQNSKLRIFVSVYASDTPEVVLFKSKEVYATGMGTFNSGERIGAAYAVIGRKVADYFRRKTF